MPQACLLFTQHIRYGFTRPLCWYQLGLCVWVRVCLCLRSSFCVCECVCLSSCCQDSHLTYTRVYQMRISCQPPEPPHPSTSHSYIGVWYRYRSKTVAADLSLSLLYAYCIYKNKDTYQHLCASCVKRKIAVNLNSCTAEIILD